MRSIPPVKGFPYDWDCWDGVTSLYRGHTRKVITNEQREVLLAGLDELQAARWYLRTPEADAALTKAGHDPDAAGLRNERYVAAMQPLLERLWKEFA